VEEVAVFGGFWLFVDGFLRCVDGEMRGKCGLLTAAVRRQSVRSEEPRRESGRGRTRYTSSVALLRTVGAVAKIGPPASLMMAHLDV
jgi:hypothetical protein